MDRTKSKGRIKAEIVGKILLKRGKTMKEDEKKPLNWEIADPKPPIIHSGHFENRKQN